MNTSPSTESVRAGQPALDLPRSRSAQAHPRVNRALRCLPERLASNSDDSLKALADVAGLSPSRFMHVFTASVGMPLRRYILNLRLECACRELAAGGTVTSAAFVAGFSDAAHLTRTFRKAVGTTPTDHFQRRARQE